MQALLFSMVKFKRIKKFKYGKGIFGTQQNLKRNEFIK